MSYLKSVIREFENYKLLGEKTFEQVSDETLYWQYNAECNSIATIVKHLSGNMISRWTDFFTTDGEKEWRKRDTEFDNDIHTREKMMKVWNEGWDIFLKTLKSLKDDDLQKIIYIRGQAHSVLEAINRQLAHYPYHIGQIVFIGKMAAKEWHSLSIPKGGSQEFNHRKFSQSRHSADHTGDLQKKSNDDNRTGGK